MSDNHEKSFKMHTLEELVSMHVALLLDSKQITPAMLYCILIDGYNLCMNRNGLSEKEILQPVIQAILDPFAELGRAYMNPYQLAILKNNNYPESDDFEPLKY